MTSLPGENFARLLVEQTKAIKETAAQISKLTVFKSDYSKVQNKLLELSTCFTKEAYLPFGKKAFVPGRFIHTNEVLVYLGGHHDFFAEMSTNTALQLLDKRISRLDSQIDDLNKQKGLLTSRSDYTSKLVKGVTPCEVVSGSGDHDIEQEVEIKEEFDPLQEESWHRQHAINVRKERQSLNASSLKPTKRVSFADQVESIATSSDDSSSELSDVSQQTSIQFTHSSAPGVTPRSEVTDRSSMTPAEAANLLSRLSAVASKVDPFTDVQEHTGSKCQPALTSQQFTSAAENRPVSRFRAQRQQKHMT